VVEVAEEQSDEAELSIANQARPSMGLDSQSKLELLQIQAVDRSELYERLVNSLFDAVYLVNPDRRIVHWNPAAEKIAGYTKEEVCGHACYENILVHVDERGTLLCFDGCPLQKTLQDGKSREGHVFLRHKLGYRVPVTVHTEPIFDQNGNVVAALEVFRDASPRNSERRIAELEKLAFVDWLTHMPNRRYLEMRFPQLLAEQHAMSDKMGILMLDLDDFKNVNDSYGHQSGDQVLASIAKTLTGALRDSDIAGRWGGDEFLALLPDASKDGLHNLAERCRVLIAQTQVECGSQRVSVTASVGAVYVCPEDTMQTALARADLLLYESKKGGRDRVVVEG
jgi:diguanylate cyclase (GGDEF)-like protein/PAS domain S-box-containing protein